MNQNLSKVLYVDDEEINLINFREALCDKFDIFTVLSGEEALKVLEEGNGCSPGGQRPADAGNEGG